MRSILLHIFGDPCLEARTQVALDLARAFGGHVTCLQAIPFEYGLPGDLYGASLAQLSSAIREESESLRAEMIQRMEKEDVSWDWVAQDGAAQSRLIYAASLNDVIVMGACSEGGQGNGYSRLAAEIVTAAQTPVLLVPENAEGLDLSGPAAIAWNGSVESSRALRAAVPLLQKSRSVHLLTVMDGSDGDPGLPATEGAAYLSRHGIECEVTILHRDGSRIADVLTEAALARRARWIAQGAYGHSRLRESFLGGVTRSAMENPQLPLLLMH